MTTVACPRCGDRVKVRIRAGKMVWFPVTCPSKCTTFHDSQEFDLTTVSEDV